jgi:hypothetical protein
MEPDPRILARFDLLARALIWAAAVVLILSVISAIAISTSDNSLPFFEDLQRESRGIAAIATFAAGIAAAGVLSGLGAILQLLLLDRAPRPEPRAAAEGERPRPRSRERSPRGAGAGGETGS